MSVVNTLTFGLLKFKTISLFVMTNYELKLISTNYLSSTGSLGFFNCSHLHTQIYPRASC